MSQQTKTCSKCGEVKRLEEFSSRKHSVGGRRAQCRACVNASKKPRIKREHHHRLSNATSSAKFMIDVDYDGGAKRCKGCEKKKPLAEFYRQKAGIGGRTAWCKQCSAERHKANRWGTYNKTHNADRAITIGGRTTSLIRAIKYRSKKKGLEFDLTRDWFIERFERGVCGVTGLSFELGGGRREERLTHPFSPSVDRISPAKGYTRDNCRLVVLNYNMAKGEFTHEDVLTWARALVRKVDGGFE